MPTKVPKILLSGKTDIGIVREENQDALLMYEPTDPAVLRNKGALVVLADGMGGLEGGRTASRLAVESFRKAYYEDSSEPRCAMANAVAQANLAIFQHARAYESGRQMGSTLTALAIVGRRAFVAQVGDSRAYRFRNGSLKLLTRDHSLARELADRGEFGQTPAFYRNILTRGLGLRDEVLPDVYEIEDLEVGDAFVLSSDGLHSLVDEGEIADCLERHGPSLEAACEELVAIAKNRGGPDNITVALALVQDLPPPPGTQVSFWSRVWSFVQGLRGRMAIFLGALSFAAGVLLTLLVQEPFRTGHPELDRAKREVENVLKQDSETVAPEIRARELKRALQLVRDALSR